VDGARGSNPQWVVLATASTVGSNCMMIPWMHRCEAWIGVGFYGGCMVGLSHVDGARQGLNSPWVVLAMASTVDSTPMTVPWIWPEVHMDTGSMLLRK